MAVASSELGDMNAIGVDPYGGVVETYDFPPAVSTSRRPVASSELGDMNAIGVDPYGGVVEPS